MTMATVERVSDKPSQHVDKKARVQLGMRCLIIGRRLNDCFRVLKEMLNEVGIVFTKHAIVIECINPTKTCIVKAKIPCDIELCERTGESLKLYIDVKDFCTKISSYPKGNPIELSLSHPSSKELKVKGNGENKAFLEFSITTLGLDHDSVPIIPITFDFTFHVQVACLKVALTIAKRLKRSYVTFKIIKFNYKNYLIIESENTFRQVIRCDNSVDYEFNQVSGDLVTTEDVSLGNPEVQTLIHSGNVVYHGQFPVDYCQNILKGLDKGSLKMEMSMDKPIVIERNLAPGHLTIVLAPKEEDADNTEDDSMSDEGF